MNLTPTSLLFCAFTELRLAAAQLRALPIVHKSHAKRIGVMLNCDSANSLGVVLKHLD